MLLLYDSVLDYHELHHKCVRNCRHRSLTGSLKRALGHLAAVQNPHTMDVLSGHRQIALYDSPSDSLLSIVHAKWESHIYGISLLCCYSSLPKYEFVFLDVASKKLNEGFVSRNLVSLLARHRAFVIDS